MLMGTGRVRLGTPTNSAINNWPVWFSRFDEAVQREPEVPEEERERVIIGHFDTGATEAAPGDFFSQDRNRLLTDLGKNYYDVKVLGTRPIDPLIKVQKVRYFYFPSHGSSTQSTLFLNHPALTGGDPFAVVVPYRVSESIILHPSDFAMLIKSVLHFFNDATKKLVARPPHVMSMSLGVSPVEPVTAVAAGTPVVGGFIASKATKHFKNLQRRFDALLDLGCIAVCAAGQIPGSTFESSLGLISYPASAKGTIAVAACDRAGVPNIGAFYGDQVDITAPGVEVMRIERVRGEDDSVTSRRVPGTGSSYATTFVAAAASLWIRHHGKLVLRGLYEQTRVVNGKPRTVYPRIHHAFRHCLHASADDRIRAPWDTSLHGAGLLDVNALLDIQLPPPNELPS